MDIISAVVCYVVACCVVYKVVDLLIRIPRVGDYSDRRILITGCDSGFGNLAAKRLDAIGCTVFAGCLTEKGETELRKTCSERLRTVSLDVTQKESVRKAFEYVSSKLPNDKGLWGILNNAGAIRAHGSLDWFSVDDYRTECEVNLWGLIDVTLTFLPLVKKAKGRIVNTSSMSGRLTFETFLPYSITKHGVEAFTDGIRRSMFVFGCKASLIEPGAFKTAILRQIGPRAVDSWSKAPQEIKTEYGEEFYRHIAETEARAYERSVATDLGPVVDAYEHALLGVYPRARYVVGFDAKYIFSPIALAPEWLGDWILRRVNGAPLPYAVKMKKI